MYCIVQILRLVAVFYMGTNKNESIRVTHHGNFLYGLGFPFPDQFLFFLYQTLPATAFECEKIDARELYYSICYGSRRTYIYCGNGRPSSMTLGILEEWMLHAQEKDGIQGWKLLLNINVLLLSVVDLRYQKTFHYRRRKATHRIGPSKSC